MRSIAEHCEDTNADVVAAFDSFMQLPDSATQRVFWLNGGAGTGKSVAAAHIMRRFLTRSTDLAVFWCKHDSLNSTGAFLV